jgi:hypothetical protein
LRKALVIGTCWVALTPVKTSFPRSAARTAWDAGGSAQRLKSGVPVVSPPSTHMRSIREAMNG